MQYPRRRLSENFSRRPLQRSSVGTVHGSTALQPGHMTASRPARSSAAAASRGRLGLVTDEASIRRWCSTGRLANSPERLHGTMIPKAAPTFSGELSRRGATPSPTATCRRAGAAGFAFRPRVELQPHRRSRPNHRGLKLGSRRTSERQQDSARSSSTPMSGPRRKSRRRLPRSARATACRTSASPTGTPRTKVTRRYGAAERLRRVSHVRRVSSEALFNGSRPNYMSTTR